MIDEVRFQRLEDKVDTVKDSVNDISKELLEQRSDMKVHMSKVQEHIAGDNKIIKELQPILAKLPDIVKMAEEYHAEKIINNKLRHVATNIVKFCGFIGVLIGVISGLSKIGVI